MSSDLKEGEDKADGEVGQPVEAAGHRVRRRSVRLLEQLRGDQEGDASCDVEETGRSQDATSFYSQIQFNIKDSGLGLQEKKIHRTLNYKNKFHLKRCNFVNKI